tara:strand:+ start:1552 stop:1818 length:267 start_codon:yes stop_codon:yes gene_type:complete
MLSGKATSQMLSLARLRKNAACDQRCLLMHALWCTQVNVMVCWKGEGAAARARLVERVCIARVAALAAHIRTFFVHELLPRVGGFGDT